MMPADLGQVIENINSNPFKDRESALSSESSEEEIRASTVVKVTNKMIKDCPIKQGGKVPDSITFTVCKHSLE